MHNYFPFPWLFFLPIMEHSCILNLLCALKKMIIYYVGSVQFLFVLCLLKMGSSVQSFYLHQFGKSEFSFSPFLNYLRVVFLCLLLFESQGFKYLVFWAQKGSGRSQLGSGQLQGKHLCSVLSQDILRMVYAWITLYGMRIILCSKRIPLKLGWFYLFQLQSLAHLWFQSHAWYWFLPCAPIILQR